MELMQGSPTEKRIDDLGRELGHRFDRVEVELHELRKETREEFLALRAEDKAEFLAVRIEMKTGFDRMEERFDGLNRLMIRFCGVALAALIGLIASLIGLFATQV